MKNFFINVLANIIGFVMIGLGVITYDNFKKIYKAKKGKKNKKKEL